MEELRELVGVLAVVAAVAEAPARAASDVGEAYAVAPSATPGEMAGVEEVHRAVAAADPGAVVLEPADLVEAGTNQAEIALRGRIDYTYALES